MYVWKKIFTLYLVYNFKQLFSSFGYGYYGCDFRRLFARTTLDDLVVREKWLHCMRLTLYFLRLVSRCSYTELFCCRVCLLEMETFGQPVVCNQK